MKKNTVVSEMNAIFAFNDKSRGATKVEVYEIFDEIVIRPINKNGQPSEAVSFSVETEFIPKLIQELDKLYQLSQASKINQANSKES